MTEEDKELSAWRAEWQALGGKDDLASKLVARAAKDGRRMRFAAAKEVLAATFSSAVCLWLVQRFHGSAEIAVMTAVILLFNGAWLTHFFSSRADLFTPSGEGVDAFIDLTRKRLATETKWARYARLWTAFMSAALTPWSVWVFYAHREAYFVAPWRAVVGFGGAAAIFAGVYMVALRKERKLRAQTEAFESNLAGAELA